MSLTPEQQVLVITMEECGELIQECSKILRFGNDDGGNHLMKEMGDVFAMLVLLCETYDMTPEEIKVRVDAKYDKLKKYSNIFD